MGPPSHRTGIPYKKRNRRKELTQRPSEDIGRRGHLQTEKRGQKKPALLASDLRLSSPEMRERSVCEAQSLAYGSGSRSENTTSQEMCSEQ